MLLSKNLLEVIDILISKDYFRYREAVSAVARYHGEVSSPQASSPYVPATSLEYYVDVSGEAGWSLPDMNAAGDPLELIFLKSRFTELRKAGRRSKVAVFSYMVDVVDLSLRRVSVPVAGAVSINDPLRRNVNLFDLRTRFDRSLVQLSGVILK